MSWNANTATNEGPSGVSSLATRRRRRRPSDQSASWVSYPMTSTTTFRNNSIISKASGSSSMSLAELPTHQGDPSESTTTNPPRLKSRRSCWSGKSSAMVRCICSYLKPHWMARVLGFLLVVRLLYSHFYFVSLSHERTLSMPSTSTSSGRLFEVVLSPMSSTFHSIDPSAMFASRPSSPKWLQERRVARMQRTRPGFVDEQGLARAGALHLDHPVIDVSATKGEKDWKSLCKQSNMNSGSRVLIFNLLSHPTGSAVAKLIAKQCGVQQITGADPMLPNLRRTRMTLLGIQKELMRTISKLQVIVTEPGMGLHEKNRLQPLAWLNKARPTHVLILDPVETPTLVESVGGLPSFQNYALQQLRHVWQDLSMTVKQLPVRILHVASPFLGEISQNMGLASVSTWDMHIPFSFATLSLGSIDGPGIFADLFPESPQPAYVDDGLQAVMTGWQRPKQIVSLTLTPQPINSEKAVHTSAWKDYLAYPFSMNPTTNQTMLQQTRKRLQTTGNEPTALPCASQCQTASSLRTCKESEWDRAIAPSVAATEGCEYALFMANFSTNVDEAPKHVDDPNLCRVFYISQKSPLAKEFKSEKNGKASSNGWTLVWTSMTEKTYTANDSALLRIDPSRLFSSSVRKAMHVNTLAFASAPDQALLSILTQIDRPEVKEGERRIREVRPGTDLKRWKPLPAEPARRVALFGGSPMPENRPATLPDYKRMMGNAVSQRQIVFYQQLAHWVHVNLDRPEDEIRSTVYLKFPFEWTSRYFIVHDLTLEKARELRCTWLEEHWTWNAKPSFWDTEDLSLAFVLGSMKTVESIGVSTNEPEQDWFPFLNEDQNFLLEGEDQVYLRLMQPREE